MPSTCSIRAASACSSCGNGVSPVSLDKIPLLSTSTVDGINLPALQEAAVGVAHASPWGPDFPNAENKRFVAEFEKKYGREPSEYAATAYDSALLLDAAIAKVNGNVSDKKAFMAALKSAEFPSVRGKFKFNHNQLAIQDFYVFDVVKDATRAATPTRPWPRRWPTRRTPITHYVR